MIIFDDLFRMFLHGRSLSSLDRHDLLFPQSRTTIIAQNSCLCLCWSWTRLLHDIASDPLSSLSDFKDKSQYYFQNLDVSGRHWLGQRAILPPAGFLWPTDCMRRSYRLRFKLAEMNSIDTFLYTEHCRYYNCERMFCWIYKVMF